MTDTNTLTPHGMSPEEAAQVKAMVDQVKTMFAERETEAAKGLEKRDGELLEQMDKRINDVVAKLEAHSEAQLKKFRVPGLKLASEDKENGYSLSRNVWAHAHKDYSGAPIEREVQNSLEKSGAYEKAQSLGNNANGGFIVPENQAETIIEILRANTVSFKLGATRLEGLDRSPYIFPRRKTSVSAVWGNEASTITATDSTFEQVSMQPRELKSLNTYSNTLLRTSHPSIDQLVMNDMSEQISRGLDLGILTGSAAAEPDGIGNTANISTTSVSAPPTYNELQGFIAALRTNDALNGSLGWAMAPEVLNAIDVMVNATNQELHRRMLADGPITTLLGHPFETTSQLPATVSATNSIIFGNWSDVMVGFWGAMEIVTSADSRFSTNEMQIRGVLYADVGVRQPKSFCVTA